MTYKINPFTGRLDWSSGGGGAFGEAVELTISGGIAVKTGAAGKNLLVDTEGDAATDNLDNITGYDAGDEVRVSPASSARTIVVKNSATMALQGVDFTMDNADDLIVLLNKGSDTWKEVTRASNGV
ncbi:MAG: hypothetical protein ABIL06_13340 [Pseudomonadota bacterium]|uniref:Uncharacterized protein n=1 Tax=viral metagenome TaxID=1070528 RepID=A0A6M3XC36_9ZZZZ